GQLDGGRVFRTAGAARQLGGPLGHGLVPARARHGLVDQAPLHGLGAPDALGLGGEVSARSRRTCRLSDTRVSPPVPGSPPSSGSSGSDTAEDRSSTSMMCSQASASSYPPPEAVPFTAAR